MSFPIPKPYAEVVRTNAVLWEWAETSPLTMNRSYRAWGVCMLPNLLGNRMASEILEKTH